MSLLPSRPDTSAAEESAPRVVGVDSDAADDLLAALSSATAREILSELHDDPAPPSELADRVDTSLQNVQYHLENLDDADAVEVVDTVYSAKGREMDVYAPADRPLVVYAGDEGTSSSIRAALSRLLGSLGVLLVGSLLVQQWIGDGIPLPVGGTGGAGGGAGGEGGDGGDGAAEVAATPTAEPTPTATPTPTESGGGSMEIAEATPAETATPAPEATSTPLPTDTATPVPTEEMAAETAVRTVQAGGVDPLASGLPPGLLFFAGGVVVLVAVVAFQYVGQ